jgi:hypothetical protein
MRDDLQVDYLINSHFHKASQSCLLFGGTYGGDLTLIEVSPTAVNGLLSLHGHQAMIRSTMWTEQVGWIDILRVCEGLTAEEYARRTGGENEERERQERQTDRDRERRGREGKEKDKQSSECEYDGQVTLVALCGERTLDHSPCDDGSVCTLLSSLLSALGFVHRG